MATMKRTVWIVDEQPVKPNGKARTFGYGFAAIATAAGVSDKTIRRAIGKSLNPKSLVSVARYIRYRRDTNPPLK